jgi:endonuclease/exonuclease/phosphatase (EEP) superfamily protein YafD
MQRSSFIDFLFRAQPTFCLLALVHGGSPLLRRNCCIHWVLDEASPTLCEAGVATVTAAASVSNLRTMVTAVRSRRVQSHSTVRLKLTCSGFGNSCMPA